MIEFENETDITIKAKEILQFEEENDLKLPEAYKKQLLKHNGGMPIDEVHIKVNGDELEFEYFYPFKEEDEISLRERFKDDLDILPPKHLSIGAIETGSICINLSDKKYGEISLYYSDLEMVKVANSFENFVDQLKKS